MIFSLLPFAAAAASVMVACAGLLQKKRSIAAWYFFAGMLILGIHSAFTGLSLRAAGLPGMFRWLEWELWADCLLPATWLAFSLAYSRGQGRESLARWRYFLIVLALLPLAMSLLFRERLIEPVQLESEGQAIWLLRLGSMGKALNAIVLVSLACILMNLEQTFRAAVGTSRWRIKFVVLGLAVIFGAHLYVRSQALLFSAHDLRLAGVKSSALLIGCIFLAMAYTRTKYAEIDVYPSRAVLRTSLTVFIAGGYLFIVGVLASIVRRLGGVESFQFGAFVILLGMAGLGMLLLSDRLRQRIHDFVNRHFVRGQYDSARIWTGFSRRLANVKDPTALCAASARLISETFEVLSASIWLSDEQKEQLTLAASTAPQPAETTAAASGAVAAALRTKSAPFDLEGIGEPWGDELRRLNPSTFPNGGKRWCVPLRAGERNYGALVLADRVNGAHYTVEELHLLRCIADQVTSVLLNLRLANEVARARELEAFRTMSAFFAHDLKNAVSSLNLMLKNLPAHFDNPAFRQDLLRGIGNTAARIDAMIGRLTALRQRPEFKPVEADLNGLVSDVLERLGGIPQVELTKEFHPLPGIPIDREQIQSVVTNLVLNARDAVRPGGFIRVRTEHLGDSAVLSVQDNGCGMSPAFIRDSLFRPFQSTKKQGLGIGMFQARMFVEAHGGSIRVESEAGKGTTFRVSLPVKNTP